MCLLPRVRGGVDVERHADATVFVFYPSGKGIEQVCIGETCFTPTHQSSEIIPWSQPIPYVRVTQRGVYHYSFPIPETPS